MPPYDVRSPNLVFRQKQVTGVVLSESVRRRQLSNRSPCPMSSTQSSSSNNHVTSPQISCIGPVWDPLVLRTIILTVGCLTLPISVLSELPLILPISVLSELPLILAFITRLLSVMRGTPNLAAAERIGVPDSANCTALSMDECEYCL